MTPADLLAAILENPHDDAPRLAFAAALAGSDPQRGEFIRAQVALAQPGNLDRLQRRSLGEHAKTLVKAHGPRWRSELAVLPGVTWGERFERGFIHSCSVKDGETFRREAASIFAVAPIEGLSVGARMDDAEATRLAACPFLVRLRTLSLWNGTLTDVGARALAASPYLGRLRLLDLTQNKIGSGGLQALAHSPALSSLTGLHLYGNKIDTAGIIDLAASPLATRLRQLNVGGSSATVAAARALAESSALVHLRELDIDNSRIGDAGLMYLAHSPYLFRLRELYLRHTDIGDAGIAVLLRSPLAPHLRVLDIEAANITNATAWQIVRSPDLGRLRKLEMWDCDNLGAPVANALKLRFGKRVTVHADDRPRRAKPNPEAATRAAFLADIRSAPEDDTPRLIYADWLHDHGDPERAEFIRLQCELAALAATDPRRPALEGRERELLERHRIRWTEGAFLAWLEHPMAECPDLYTHKVCKIMASAVKARLALAATVDAEARGRLETQLQECATALGKHRLLEHQARLPLFASCLFQRGFPETVTVPELMLPDFATAVRDLGVIRHLAVQSDPEDATTEHLVGRVIACFDVPRLRSLRVNHVEKLAAFEMVAAWPGAAELAHLEFGFVWAVPGDDVLRVLAASPYLRNLERLDLYLCEGCTEAGVQALIDSAHLPSLKAVSLGEEENEVPEAAVRLLRERFPASR